MPLPKIGTVEWDQEIKFFQSATLKQRHERAAKLGYTDESSYREALRRRGVYKEKAQVPDLPPGQVERNPKVE